MFAIIHPYIRDLAWSGDLFPDWSMCSLPVAGKPLSEYAIDLCSILHAEKVLLCDFSYNTHFNKTLSMGNRWPMPVNYIGTQAYETISLLLKHNHAFLNNEDTLIFWGALLPDIISPEEAFGDLEPQEPTESLPLGVYLKRNGTLYHCRSIHIHPVETLLDYFNLNFDMLEDNRGHVLPGYSNENKVYTGMNVAIMQNATVSAPVMLCDDVCLNRGCSLSDGVIVGRNVMIDSETQLKHSIVLDYTYVAQDMIFKNKIITSDRIIDPYSEAYLSQEDLDLAMDMRRFGRIDWYKFVEYIFALLLCLVFFIPYLLLLPWIPLLKRGYWYRKLSLDRYPLCLKVLINKARLVRFFPEDDVFVFRASDILPIQHSSEQQELDDILYRHNRSLLLIIKIILKGLINRVLDNGRA